VVPRGQGHSVAGQAQAPGGIVLDLRGLDEVFAVAPDRVVVGAGARWSQVLAATLPYGRTPPVLTDYLELSVGGTLSVGGIGGTTHRYGLQTDQVLELDVVTWDGAVHTCAPTRNRELFDAVRAGHGRHGIIVRSTLALVPAPARIRRHHLHYPALGPFLAAQRRLIAEGRFDHVTGQAQLTDGTWQYVLDAASFGTDVPPTVDLGHATEEVEDLDYAAFANRMAPTETLLRELGAWHHPHPWLNLFLPGSRAEHVIATGLTSADIGETGVVLISAFLTDRIATPGVRLPSESRAVLFALLRTAPPDAPDTLREMLDANAAIQALALAAGGSVYL
jgi:FAD/FMN-containing dehydrogenase